jgi:hypothetical protein
MGPWHKKFAVTFDETSDSKLNFAFRENFDMKKLIAFAMGLGLILACSQSFATGCNPTQLTNAKADCKSMGNTFLACRTTSTGARAVCIKGNGEKYEIDLNGKKRVRKATKKQ